MRKFISILVLAFLLPGTTPVRGELDEFALGQLVKRAWQCGTMFQNARAFQVGEHYQYFRYRFMTFVKSQGALDWEIDILSAVFEAAVVSAVEQGIYSGGRYGKIIGEDEKAYYKIEFDNVIGKCAR